MNNVTAEEISKAREIKALDYLKAYMPGELVRCNNKEYCTREHDSLKFSNGKWFWWSQGIGGVSALDYLIKVENMDFVNAVQTINKRAGYIPSSSVNEEKKEVKVLIPNHNYECKTVREYLRKRCISDDVIGYFIEKRMLAEDDKTKYCLFFGNDENGNHRQCSVRATDGKDIKKEVYGSIKDYSFNIIGRTMRNSVRVFESAIDMMSFATLMQDALWDFKAENMMSVSGVYMPGKDIENSKVPASLKRYLEINPGIERVLLHFDNDKAGILASRGIKAALSDKYEVKYVPPKSGKDYNEYLCMKQREKEILHRKEEMQNENKDISDRS